MDFSGRTIVVTGANSGIGRIAARDLGAAGAHVVLAVRDIAGGSYIGSDGPGEMRGKPTLVGCSAAARDERVADRLWTRSEELTGVSFPLPAAV